jgi:hypothetical protein
MNPPRRQYARKVRIGTCVSLVALVAPIVSITSGGTIPVILTARTAYAAEPDAAAGSGQPLGSSTEEVTQSLVTLIAQYQHARSADQGALLEQLLELADARQQMLAALVEDEPAAALRAVLPAGLRASLPPALQAEVEEDVEAEGELEVRIEDRPTDSIVHYTLKTQRGEQLSLHFAAEPPTDLQTGSRVQVRGVQVKDALALSSGSTSLTTVSAALPNTFGAQKTAVILVNFQDNTMQPYTLATAQSVVFSTTSNFDYENSFQQTWLTGDVYGWFTIPMSSTVCDYSTLASYANQAATAAGVNLSNYDHYVYGFPQNACTWWGLGTVGGNPSQAWINGKFQLQVVGHEMGHNFGLYHSHSLDCGSAVIGTNCTTNEYGDTLDIMGNSQPGHFNAYQKERLGWLNYGVSPAVITVQTSGTYSIDPYESLTSNPKALKILQSTDPTTGYSTWYYVEYRQALGFDGFLSTYSNVTQGVVIHTGSESSGNSSYLLDMTPATSSWLDPALDVGQSFADPDAEVTISVVSASSSGASVSVTLGPVTCVSSNPTLTISPSQSAGVPAGSIVTYTVSVTDNDSIGCTASSFNLQATDPSGWTAAFGSSTLSTSPGSTASTTLQVTSPTSATAGSYTVGAAATNAGSTTFSGSTSAVYLVVAPTPTPTPSPTPTPKSRGRKH